MAGWNGSNGGTSASPKKSVKPKQQLALGKGALAGLLVVAAAGLAAYFLLPREKPTVKEATTEKPKVIAEVKPAAVQSEAPKAVSNAVEAVKPKGKWLGFDVDHKEVRTNGTKVVETIYTTDGKVHKYFRNAKPPVLEYASDQILAMVTQENGGGAMPPIPGIKGFENDFGDAVRKEIVINDDDSPEVKALKERVKQARKDMLQLMAEGKSAEEVLREHQTMQKENADMRNVVVTELRKYLEEGDVESAQALCDKMNPILENNGIMRVEMPRAPEEVRAERLARRALRNVQQENN